MKGHPVGPGGEDITWPDQVAPRGRKASSTRKVKPQNLKTPCFQHLFKTTYNPPHTEKGRCTRAYASVCLVVTISYSPCCAQ